MSQRDSEVLGPVCCMWYVVCRKSLRLRQTILCNLAMADFQEHAGMTITNLRIERDPSLPSFANLILYYLASADLALRMTTLLTLN